MIKKGSKAPKAIKELQTNLNRLGYKTLIDGKFGAETDRNLRAFQKANALKVDGIYGSLTDAALQLLLNAIPAAVPVPVSNSETPWMDYVKRHIGQKEIPGAKHNQFIVDLFNYTSLKGLAVAQRDETAWCAALANAALVKNGMVGTNSAAAASFDKYPGEKLTPQTMKYGALVTTKTTTGSRRHITFFEKWVDPKTKTKFIAIGGNQGNALKRSTFAVSKVATVHWPSKAVETKVEA